MARPQLGKTRSQMVAEKLDVSEMKRKRWTVPCEGDIGTKLLSPLG